MPRHPVTNYPIKPVRSRQEIYDSARKPTGAIGPDAAWVEVEKIHVLEQIRHELECLSSVLANIRDQYLMDADSEGETMAKNKSVPPPPDSPRPSGPLDPTHPSAAV